MCCLCKLLQNLLWEVWLFPVHVPDITISSPYLPLNVPDISTLIQMAPVHAPEITVPCPYVSIHVPQASDLSPHVPVLVPGMPLPNVPHVPLAPVPPWPAVGGEGSAGDWLQQEGHYQGQGQGSLQQGNYNWICCTLRS